MKTLFVSDADDPEDMKWLRETHLPELPEKFKSALVYGNEDSPDKIVVYEDEDPRFDDKGVAYMRNGDGYSAEVST